MKIALSIQGAEQVEQLARDISATSIGVQHSCSDLTNEFNSVRNDLGELEDEIAEMVQRAKAAAESVQEACRGLPNTFNEYGNTMRKVLNKNH